MKEHIKMFIKQENNRKCSKYSKKKSQKRALPPDDVEIPPMPKKQRKKVVQILEAKKRHLDFVDAQAAAEPRKNNVNQFSVPVNEDSEFVINDAEETQHCRNPHPPNAQAVDDADYIDNEEEYELLPMLIAKPKDMRHCTDETFYKVIPMYYKEVKKISTSARAFDNAIVQIKTNFNGREIEDAFLTQRLENW